MNFRCIRASLSINCCEDDCTAIFSQKKLRHTALINVRSTQLTPLHWDAHLTYWNLLFLWWEVWLHSSQWFKEISELAKRRPQIAICSADSRRCFSSNPKLGKVWKHEVCNHCCQVWALLLLLLTHTHVANLPGGAQSHLLPPEYLTALTHTQRRPSAGAQVQGACMKEMSFEHRAPSLHNAGRLVQIPFLS